jgi:hypothetical protein
MNTVMFTRGWNTLIFTMTGITSTNILPTTARQPHAHRHKHEQLIHAHPHYPDIDHRHKH